ncbi:MAG TPA: hypothetical protein VK766_05115 [Cytophagaceae bacterium]|jgi:hypothetical protein|nr:hypothetical protein [Cytophagaceae bacterium]
MNGELLLSDKKFRWISTIYYQVANSSDVKINPFVHLVDFLEAKVGDLNWGADEKTRKLYKSSICNNFVKMLGNHGYYVSGETIIGWLSDDSLSNEAVAQRLVASARND